MPIFSFLYRILVLVFVVLIFRRILNVFTKNRKQTESKDDSTGTANPMVKDPVCGMYMDSRLAVRLDSRSEAFYFCSEECKKKYLNRSTGDGMGSAAG